MMIRQLFVVAEHKPKNDIHTLVVLDAPGGLGKAEFVVRNEHLDYFPINGAFTIEAHRPIVYPTSAFEA